MLDEEERQDTQMREHFKEKWTPKPSAELTVNLREECAKYRAIVENATNADKVVKEKYNTHRKSIELLSKSDVSLRVQYLGVFYTHIICFLLKRKFFIMNIAIKQSYSNLN